MKSKLIALGILAGTLFITQTGFAQYQYTINTFAGNGSSLYSADGVVATSEGIAPTSTAIDDSGNVYIADFDNNRIRKVNTSGIITTFAGIGTVGFSGDGGAATSAELYNPSGVAVDHFGNVYIADKNNNRIRKVTGGIITTFAGNGIGGYAGEGIPADSASLWNPRGVAVDDSGNVYIADQINNRIRKVSNGTIITIAGGSGGFAGDGGPATAAEISSPCGVAVDASYNVYIADNFNHRIRKITNGIITTIAGNGTASFSGDGGPADSASLWNPNGVAVDDSGNVYVADFNNHRIRYISNGIITTIAGNGTQGFSGDLGYATLAELYNPTGVTVDASGKVYIADNNNYRVRILNSTISINENLNPVYITAFPNPTTDLINITTSLIGIQVVIITNVLGEVVWSSPMNLEAGGSFTVDMFDKPAGIYSIQIGNSSRLIIKP